MRRPKSQVSVDPETRDLARDAARRENITISEFVSQAIRDQSWQRLREGHRRPPRQESGGADGR
jgi:hypothetical protein